LGGSGSTDNAERTSASVGIMRGSMPRCHCSAPPRAPSSLPQIRQGRPSIPNRARDPRPVPSLLLSTTGHTQPSFSSCSGCSRRRRAPLQVRIERSCVRRPVAGSPGATSTERWADGSAQLSGTKSSAAEDRGHGREPDDEIRAARRAPGGGMALGATC